ncbi:protein TSSC4-like [Stegodyphus dumicola]|uniref:protein TSSC4-like n=1 Tax=Stegodyphus dumicola TaxID=202533 RepID=UPI0015A930B2|nr:protein TSSC4-like [Stegodyphus dumicola]
MVKTVILPSTVTKRLISTLGCPPAVHSNDESQNFCLKGSKEFASRSGNVFGELEILEKNHETWVSENYTHDCFEEPASSTEICVKTEIFKKPTIVPLSKRRSDLRFKRRSQKWTYYSLADVPITSDATNAAVAVQFLNELRKRHENNNDGEKSQNEGKIMFSKPTRKRSRRFPHTESSESATSETENFTNLTINKEERAPKVQKVYKLSSINVKLDHLQNDF